MRKLRAFGGTGHRLVAFDDPRFYQYVRELDAAGFGVAVVLTSDSFLTDDYAAEAADYAARLPSSTLWLVGNEWDANGDASWPVGQEAFAALWNRAAGAIRAVHPAARLYVGGLFACETALDTLDAVWGQLDPAPTGVDIHPYQLSSHDTRMLLSRIAAIFGTQTAVMEWNWASTGDIGRFQTMLNLRTAHSCWIPAVTGQIPDLPGVWTPKGNLTSYGRAYKAAIKGAL